MKTLTRGYCIQEDITDPTPWEEETTGEKVCECFICGEDIDTDTERVYNIDGLEEAPMCERCYCFKKFTPNDLLDMLGIDVTRCSGSVYSTRMTRKRRGA